MSTRGKSDFGSGKVLPGELSDGELPVGEGGEGGGDAVHPERGRVAGPDIPAAEAAHDHAEGVAAVERGSHFRPDEPDAVPDEPVDTSHPPKHARPSGTG
jgi:hypothetical protein